ncbi:MAG: AraC family transcriptional regulator, partial [Sneathiella sp.]|nr:AraC family transcriptional regulator [Sneathiella sp.]
MTKRIILFASHGLQALDVTGPSSVFSTANKFMADEKPYRVELVSPAGGLIKTISGVSLDTASIAETSPKGIDTILVTGHDTDGHEALVAHDAAKEWVTDAAQGARRWGSVCVGALALASWGLLSKRTVTTHWAAAEELARMLPNTSINPDSLYVVDDDLWTSAGVTAGIDMSLAMVEADLGSDIAAQIARSLVVYLRRPGSQSQFSGPLKAQYASASSYRELIEWAEANLDADLSVETLAARAGHSTRTFQRHFADQIGRTPAAYIED